MIKEVNEEDEESKEFLSLNKKTKLTIKNMDNKQTD
jgi:hypothetical protein